MASESDFTPLITLPRWSFGLRQLFLWTAAVALGLLALRSASAMWVAAMLALVLFVLTVSVLLVVFRRGSQRAYWIGFATFGCLYMLLLGASWQSFEPNTFDDTPLEPHNLFTQRLASAAYHWLYDEAFQNYYNSMPSTGAGGYAGGMMGSGSMSGMYPGGGPGGMPMGSGMGGMGGTGPPPGPPPGPDEGSFVNVAHALWALLLACVGGCIAWWLYTSAPARTERPAAAQSPDQWSG